MSRVNMLGEPVSGFPLSMSAFPPLNFNGFPEGFGTVLDLVEKGCQGILAEVMRAGG